MNRKETDSQPPSPKFQAFELVRIKRAADCYFAEKACPGDPTPPANAMGLTGPILMGGMHYVYDDVAGPKLTQSYSVQLDDVGIILVSEDWLEDGEPAS
ncbi:MAG: hypothetical protein H8E48_07245 [Chloroflexi bacterium]|nr:hypothetical protein [Chloroflexota bacterium]